MATITDLETTTSGATSRTTINTNFDNLNTEIALCLHADGSVNPSANLPMNSKKLTGLAAGSANGDSVRYEQVLLLAGGTMAGDINMGGNEILNIPSILDVNSNEVLKFSSVESAINEIAIKNAASGNGAEIQSTGGDDNIDIKLSPKGSGKVDVDTSVIENVIDPSSAQDAATKNYVDTDGTYHNVGARAYLSSPQLNIVDSTATKVLLDSKTYDLGGDFASNKFTAPVAGYYMINGQNGWGGLTVNKYYRTYIYKNGTNIAFGCNVPSLATTITVPVFTICHMNATDYIELYAYHNAGVNTPDIYGDANATWTYMEVFLLKRD